MATIASRADPPLIRGVVGRASQGIQHKRLRPRRRCLLATFPRLQRAHAQSVYQSGCRRLRNPLPAAYGFQLFGKSHGPSIRETRIVIKQQTDVAQRGAIPRSNLKFRGTAKTAKMLSRGLFSIRADRDLCLPQWSKSALLKTASDRIWSDEIRFSSPSRSAIGRGSDRQTRAGSG